MRWTSCISPLVPHVAVISFGGEYYILDFHYLNIDYFQADLRVDHNYDYYTGFRKVVEAYQVLKTHEDKELEYCDLMNMKRGIRL